MEKKECSKEEFHIAVPRSIRIPLARLRHHMAANCTHTETVQCDLQDFVFANCPGKAVFGLADSQRASKTISSLNKLPKAAEPMIKDL